MNFFCRLLGHTWVPFADNPKTNWNIDKDGMTLIGRPAGEVRLWDECARCRERREVFSTLKRPTADAR